MRYKYGYYTNRSARSVSPEKNKTFSDHVDNLIQISRAHSEVRHGENLLEEPFS